MSSPVGQARKTRGIDKLDHGSVHCEAYTDICITLFP